MFGLGFRGSGFRAKPTPKLSTVELKSTQFVTQRVHGGKGLKFGSCGDLLLWFDLASVRNVCSRRGTVWVGL